jgi:poly(beta-D-mannuronate) lyase
MEKHLMSRRGLFRVAGATAALSAPLSGLAAPAHAVDASSPGKAGRSLNVTNPQELATAINDAAPGDTIVMKRGVWTNTNIQISAPAQHGTAAARITLRAEVGGQTILNGISKLTLGRDYWTVDGLSFIGGVSTKGVPVISFGFNAGETPAHHSELANVSMKDYGMASDPSYSWVILSGTDNVVRNCGFTGKRNPSNILTGDYATPTPRRYHIHHNYFGDFPGSGNPGEWGAVVTGAGAYEGLERTPDYVIIENNLFRNCSGESEVVSVKSGNDTVRNNTFVECGGYVSLRIGDNSEVSGNYFFGNYERGYGNSPHGSGGIRISGSGHSVHNNYIADAHGSGIVIQNKWTPSDAGYTATNDVEVAYNTIVNSFTSGIIIGWPWNGGVDNTPPDNISIANNIVTSFVGKAFDYVDGTNLTYAGNIAYGPSIGLDPLPPGVVVADPLLQPEMENGYAVLRPSSGSPAIQAAAAGFDDVTDDIEGKHRRRGKSTVGAYEASAGRVVSPPLTRLDVGPEYMAIS